jgi:hypothetical protein
MSEGFEEMPHGVCSFFVFCWFSRGFCHLLWLDIQQMVTDALFLRTLVVTGSEQMHVFWFVLLHFFQDGNIVFFTALMEHLYQIAIHCWSFVESRLSVGPWWSSRDNLSHGWIPQLFIRDKRGTKFHSYSVVYHYYWWVLVLHYSEIIHMYIFNLYNYQVHWRKISDYYLNSPIHSQFWMDTEETFSWSPLHFVDALL